MAGPNMDQFEAYFRRADLDGDGRISGAEAVSFFQGSNLPKQVLAQIWVHADQNKTSFLGRAEFYNALRLVTVAQSKRELTPDIVKAALYGPAAAKIPAPQINLSATPAPQPNSMAAASAQQRGQVAPPSQNFGYNLSATSAPLPKSVAPASAPQMGSVAPPSQNFGFRGPGVANANINQNYFPPQQNQSLRPPQAMPASSMAATNVLNSNMSNNWLSGSTGAPPSGSIVTPRATNPSVPLSAPRPQHPVSTSLQATGSDTKGSVVSGNGFASASSFGGDVFSAAPSAPKEESSRSAYSGSSVPASFAAVPVSSGTPLSGRSSSLNSLQDAFSLQPSVSQFQQPQTSLNTSQQGPAPVPSSIVSSGISAGIRASTPSNSQLSWPKMKPSDIQKYTKVFMEVDADRDGRITGEEAKNLFLSWRLPREVLKQVWDLSDQDSDSMLSLREFCFALYLMERYREGLPLPAVLPNNVMYDETLLSMTGQPRGAYGNAAWNPSHGVGFGQQQRMQASQPLGPTSNLRPPVQAAPKPDGILQPNQQNSRAPVLEDSFLDRPNNANQEATAAGNKVDEPKKVILDSKEKIEFYRTKMQELVLYKSRCDNKLNEITERASADKREAESLGKKYEEKYKQVAEIASKLTIEEATFREIQSRKMELHQAIVKMEQGGSADGILQVRADRIQYDLEELLKALTERCKKHGLNVKSGAIIEIPKGWEPGIQEGAAVWDEDWDKFEDEGFAHDLAVDVKKNSVHPTASPDRTSTPDSSSIAGEKPGYSSPNAEQAFESDSAFTHGEDEYARSPHDSPASRTVESPFQEADAETQRSFDDSTWGAFDNDDTDSVWGFNASKTKDSDSEKHGDFFGSDNFGINPVRTGSPHGDGTFQRKSPFSFDDSVPGTPLSRFGNSPRYSEAGDHYFDNFSGFDSYSMHDGAGGFGSQPERFTRFDSMNSSTDFGHNPLSRFDSSSRDFGLNSEKFTRFDSMSSSKDFGHSGAFSFDDTDPFGSSGTFKVSSENQTPKKSSDSWSAF
ncbi:hypothetical protein UlMin_033916 [Ulmus minor]